MDLLWALFFLGLGYFTGTAIEKKHYRDILAQEKIYFNLPVITSKKLEDETRIGKGVKRAGEKIYKDIKIYKYIKI